MQHRLLPTKMLVFILFVVVLNSCNREKEPAVSLTPKIDKLKLPEGFRAEHIYSPSEHEHGSWVSMTFDDKGRMIVSDQYGDLYRLTIPAIGASSVTPRLEKLTFEIPAGSDSIPPKIIMGYAHGLLWAFNSLYVMVNHNTDENFGKGSGLYRVQDTDGDDRFDKITLLKGMHGEGEHGPHSIVLSPDKKSIYVIAGNFTDLPEMNAYRLPKTLQQDNLLPLMTDPNGHAADRTAPGSWIAKIDSTGSHWELISAGYRNAFDMAFNADGELFTYDSDMEWDMGTPWYVPTRICHVTSGSEYGWRTGDSRWSPVFADNLPALLNIGPGSPTNLMSGQSAKFPTKYRNGLFAFDWSFGIIYAVHLKPEASSYKATAEEFISGSPLPLTDGVIGPDGALYFITGGRRLDSDLYRVYYDGKESVDSPSTAVVSDKREIRQQLEAFHGAPNAKAIEFAWPFLKDEDRFIRYAARIAVEHQPVKQWQDKALNEKDPIMLTHAMIALARNGNASLKGRMLRAITAIDLAKLTTQQQIDVLRATEIIMARMGKPAPDQLPNVIAWMDGIFPAKKNDVNRMLSKLLVYIGSPSAVEKTLALFENAKDDADDQKGVTNSSDLILRNPQYGLDIAGLLSNTPPAQQIYYATVLSEATTGWTPGHSEKYFKWISGAFDYKGGHSYAGFIEKARQMALAHVPTEKKEIYTTMSAPKKSLKAEEEIEGPEGPGRQWKLNEAVTLVGEKLTGRDFERGSRMYKATLCASCHAMRGEGGAIGPDLTQLGTRFSSRDILESVIEPNKVISDQYAATVFTMNDGTTMVGRVTNQDDNTYFVSQNPFNPQAVREVVKKNVLSKKLSTVSVMMPGMINSLNEEELKDLRAYLVSGGDKGHEVFK